jgi:hypothetical protein
VEFRVLLTPVADRQRAALRGRAKRAYDSFVDDIRRRGCAALTYRLSGPEPLSGICVKHLYGSDRALVVFTDDTVWIVLIAAHTPNSADNVYDILYRHAGASPEPEHRREKPPCCGDGEDAPELSQDAVDDLLHSLTRLGRR